MPDVMRSHSPEAFGAKGDGITDDTAAVQKAFNQFTEVHLTPGMTYLVSSLTIPTRKYWRLEGHGAKIKKKPGRKHAFMIATSGMLDGRRTAHPPLSINNTHLDGNSACDSILLLQAWNSEITNCEIFNSKGNGITFTANRYQSTSTISTTLVNNRVLNCRVYANKEYGVCIEDNSRNKATDGQIVNSYIYDNGNYGIRVAAAAGWLLSGLNLYANGGGIYLDSAGKGTRISNNFLDIRKEKKGSKGDRQYSLLVKNHLNTPFLTIQGCHIGGAVSTIGQSNLKNRGIISSGNTYFAGGHIYISSINEDIVYFSNSDFFEINPPFQWASKKSLTRVECNATYQQGQLIAYSGSYLPDQ